MVDIQKKFLNDIFKYQVLPKEEQNKLIRMAQEGDIGARNKVIESNQRLVVKIAMKYFFINSGEIPLLDLIGEGNMGLIKAIENFDESKSKRFASYASYAIKSKIRDMVTRKNQIRIGWHVRKGRIEKSDYIFLDDIAFDGGSMLNHEMVAAPPDQEDSFFWSDFERICLENLSDTEMTIIKMRLMQKSYQEIGRQLNKSHQWVLIQLRRIKSKLKRADII